MMRAFLLINLMYLVGQHSNGDAAKINSGPFKATVVRAERCNQTSYPLEPDPPIITSLEVYNSTKKINMMRGNVTVIRENKHIKMKLKRYIWQDGQWKLLAALNNIGCHGVLFHTMMVALGLKYNREDCSFPKGTYSFQDLDTNVLQHLWKSETEYGRILRVTETTRGYVTYSCWEFETLVEPL